MRTPTIEVKMVVSRLDTEIELLREDITRGRFRSVLFDFDGTLSLIREGWPQVMIPMMTRILKATKCGESEKQLRATVEDFVMRLNGRQTIYQMMQLVEEVKKRGGTPLEPLAYKHQYHDLLLERIQGRLDSLSDGRARPQEWVVPGTHAFLDRLRAKGLRLYLASGTDVKYVRAEADLLDVSQYFGEHIYGALDDYQNFSKKMILEKIIRDENLAGEEVLGFGDGFVEIEEVKRVGGVAVAVASEETKRAGINDWKRERLVAAGADIVIADYRQSSRLLPFLFDPEWMP